MKYKADVKDSVLTIRITGRVNSDNAGELEEHLASIRKKHAFQSMILDFAGVEFISSAGLRVLMKLYREDGKLTVINVSDSVYDVFDITGMDDIMDIRRAEPEKGAVSDDPLNDTTWPLTFTPVTALFEEQVAAHPDRLAVVSTGVSMTYAELNEAATSTIATQMITRF